MSFAALTAGVPFRVSVVAGLRASGAASITILWGYIEWDAESDNKSLEDDGGNEKKKKLAEAHEEGAGQRWLY